MACETSIYIVNSIVARRACLQIARPAGPFGTVPQISLLLASLAIEYNIHGNLHCWGRGGNSERRPPPMNSDHDQLELIEPTAPTLVDAA